jgi:hypothetical protein
MIHKATDGPISPVQLVLDRNGQHWETMTRYGWYNTQYLSEYSTKPQTLSHGSYIGIH